MSHGLPPRPTFTGVPASTPSSSSSGSRGRGRGRGGSSSISHSATVNNNTNNNYNAYAAYGYGNASGGYAGYANASGGYAGYAYPYGAYGAYAGVAGGSGGYPGYAYSAAAYTTPAPYTVTPTPPTSSNSHTWRNCSQPGCKFTGPADKVVEHEGDRHLIFPAGKPTERSEEEERYLASLKKSGVRPTIQGTGITLETDEDISKWIEERKRKWPTRARAAEKAQEDAEAIERGENPRKRQRVDPARAAEDWGRPVDVRESARGRGRERGRGRGRGDGRVGDRRQTDATPVAVDSAEIVPADTGGTSDVSDSSSSSSDSSSSDSESDSDSDDNTKAPVKDTRPICKFFARGRCKHGSGCKFQHANPGAGDNKPRNVRGPDAADDKAVEKIEVGPPRIAPPRAPPPRRVNPFTRPSMLGALLANPIQNTLSQLTQTIRFLAANDMLRNVEMVPGQAEEMEKKVQFVVPLEDESGEEDEVSVEEKVEVEEEVTVE